MAKQNRNFKAYLHPLFVFGGLQDFSVTLDKAQKIFDQAQLVCLVGLVCLFVVCLFMCLVGLFGWFVGFI